MSFLKKKKKEFNMYLLKLHMKYLNGKKNKDAAANSICRKQLNSNKN